MRSVSWGWVLVGVLLGNGPQISQAQTSRTWVSGVGDDANPCSRTAPCKTFAGAISQTIAGGEIDILDPGGFGALTITNAITIADESVGEGGVLVPGTNGIVVQAGPNDIVILRGLVIDGGSIGSDSLNGVNFISGGVLTIQNCQIRNFQSGGSSGIFFAPSGSSSLYVSNTVVASNATGVLIHPAGGHAKASLTRVEAVNNAVGIEAEGGAGGVDLTIFDSVASGNASWGVAAVSGAARVNIKHSVSTHNGTGLYASGSGSVIRVGESLVTDNGIATSSVGGATLDSYGNNQIDDNAGPAVTLPIVPLK